MSSCLEQVSQVRLISMRLSNWCWWINVGELAGWSSWIRGDEGEARVNIGKGNRMDEISNCWLHIRRLTGVGWHCHSLCASTPTLSGLPKLAAAAGTCQYSSAVTCSQLEPNPILSSLNQASSRGLGHIKQLTLYMYSIISPQNVFYPVCSV